jgi:Ni/Fe-hydrogenase subunit HybB-like protein
MRVANRPLAFILAAALLACSVVIIAEVIGFAVHHSPLLVHWTTWEHWAQSTRWNAFVIRVWATVLMVVGLVLVVLEFKPSRVTRLPLRATDDHATDATVTRRGLARMLRTEATTVDGVTGATVRVRRRTARVTAASGARGKAAASALTQPVTRALGDRLESLDLRHAPRLTVRVVPRSR